jgi:hypothetical protein
MEAIFGPDTQVTNQPPDRKWLFWKLGGVIEETLASAWTGWSALHIVGSTSLSWEITIKNTHQICKQWCLFDTTVNNWKGVHLDLV